MKNYFITLGLIFSLGGVLNAQYIDYMGLPSKNETHIINQQKSTNELESYTIVNTIPTNIMYGTDITYDGNLIWETGYAEYFLYGLNPDNGEIVDSIAIDIKRPYGLTFDGEYFWIIDNDSFRIEKINYQTREVEDTINIFYNENTYPTSLTVVDGNIFFNDPRSYYEGADNDYTRKITKKGSLVSNYSALGEYATGICYDGFYLWSTDNISEEIYQIDIQTFQVVKTIHAPGGIYPNGLCYDGQYLWVLNNDADSIYQIDVGSISTNINDNKNIKSFSINPNIINCSASINCSNYINENIKIDIINQAGQIVSTVFKGKLTHNVIRFNINQSLQNGLYFCRISTDSKVQTEKIVIQK